jgi:hypothetical protein
MLEIVSKKNKEGTVIYECYTFNGSITAQKYYNTQGNLTLHRDSNDGPALILYYYPSEEVLCERYYFHGKLHRLSSKGPAIIIYNKDGEVYKSEFWEDNTFINKDERSSLY